MIGSSIIYYADLVKISSLLSSRNESDDFNTVSLWGVTFNRRQANLLIERFKTIYGPAVL